MCWHAVWAATKSICPRTRVFVAFPGWASKGVCVLYFVLFFAICNWVWLLGPGSLPPGLTTKRRMFDDGSSDIGSATSSMLDYNGWFSPCTPTVPYRLCLKSRVFPRLENMGSVSPQRTLESLETLKQGVIPIKFFRYPSVPTVYPNIFILIFFRIWFNLW